MAKRLEDSIEIIRMANGYMLRKAPDIRGDMRPSLQDCFVYNEFRDAASKALEMLGDVSEG